MGHYRNLGALAMFADNTWTTFLSRKTIDKTLAEGEALFKNDRLFLEYKTSFDDYCLELETFFEKILTSKVLSREQVSEALSRMEKLFFFYSKTEFFYIDNAFKLGDQNEVVRKNLKTFEEIKNGGRLKLNKIFFEPDAYRRQLVKKLSEQFNVSVKDLGMYGMKDIINLFSGVVLDDSTVTERNTSYFMDGRTRETLYLQGEESQLVVKNFYSQKISEKSLVLKGITANKGKVTARATVLEYGDNMFARLPQVIASMPQGNILIADTTAPELFMACKKASAILTNQGGMMSHAAIVSRELNIPCIVGLGNITQAVKDGDTIEVDAEKGIVKIL
jgi:phosphohistidine swiveling domain-containing protein